MIVTITIGGCCKHWAMSAVWYGNGRYRLRWQLNVHCSYWLTNSVWFSDSKTIAHARKVLSSLFKSWQKWWQIRNHYITNQPGRPEFSRMHWKTQEGLGTRLTKCTAHQVYQCWILDTYMYIILHVHLVDLMVEVLICLGYKMYMWVLVVLKLNREERIAACTSTEVVEVQLSFFVVINWDKI